MIFGWYSPPWVGLAYFHSFHRLWVLLVQVCCIFLAWRTIASIFQTHTHTRTRAHTHTHTHRMWVVHCFHLCSIRWTETQSRRLRCKLSKPVYREETPHKTIHAVFVFLWKFQKKESWKAKTENAIKTETLSGPPTQRRWNTAQTCSLPLH